ncbi:MAG: rod shape-determining protein MreD [Ignavibacteria bacterium]|nr:rod shape-determining protein MreD [Ignavibacteria bacterium]
MLRIDFAKIFPYLLYIPLLILQLTVIPIIRIEGIIPDLGIIILVLFTLRLGRLWGLTAAAIFGFVFDMVSGSAVGATMLSQSIAIFFIGFFYKDQVSERYISSYYFVLIVILAATINSFLFSLIADFDASSNLFMTLFRQGILPAMYTGLVSGFVAVLYPKRSSL